ncbi:hypothetical protein K449DRAFT_439283 [Hypoxylon sp. EC38]|nr:hypothetical protein K449DRAFT_439283 [Hypoxylon sp. EC38]
MREVHTTSPPLVLTHTAPDPILKSPGAQEPIRLLAHLLATQISPRPTGVNGIRLSGTRIADAFTTSHTQASVANTSYRLAYQPTEIIPKTERNPGYLYRGYNSLWCRHPSKKRIAAARPLTAGRHDGRAHHAPSQPEQAHNEFYSWACLPSRLPTLPKTLRVIRQREKGNRHLGAACLSRLHLVEPTPPIPYHYADNTRAHRSSHPPPQPVARTEDKKELRFFSHVCGVTHHKRTPLGPKPKSSGAVNQSSGPGDP